MISSLSYQIVIPYLTEKNQQTAKKYENFPSCKEYLLFITDDSKTVQPSQNAATNTQTSQGS